MRIGVSLSGREFGGEDIVRFAVTARRLGYDSVWLPSAPGHRDSIGLAGEITNRLRSFKIGLGVVSIYSRSPLALASSIATLSEASESRLIVGIGTGDPKWRISSGPENTHPLSYMSEYLEVLRRFLAGNRFSFNGEFLKLEDACLEVKVKHHLSIYLGATRRKMIQLASRKADGVILNGALCQSYYDSIRKVIPTSRTKSRRFQVVWPFGISLGASGSIARKKMKPYLLGLLLSGKIAPIVSASPYMDTAEKVLNFHTRTHETALDLVSDDLIDYFTVAGTPEKCARRISDLSSWGSFLPVLYPVRTDPNDLMVLLSKYLKLND